MPLQTIKMTVSGVWVVIALVIALLANLSTKGSLALLVVGLLPPLLILLLWNEPAQTMSESIAKARR